MQLVARVSGWMESTRVSSAANSSAESSGSGSLNARCPVMPMPPKAMSTPPSSSMTRTDAAGVCGVGEDAVLFGNDELRANLAVDRALHKARNESASAASIHSSSSVRYSSMLMNQQFLSETLRSFTKRTKMGYWPTGPTGQMKTVFSPRALCASISSTIVRPSRRRSLPSRRAPRAESWRPRPAGPPECDSNRVPWCSLLESRCARRVSRAAALKSGRPMRGAWPAACGKATGQRLRLASKPTPAKGCRPPP